jgi:hypothetical protein
MKYFTILISLFALNAVQAQTVLFSENFESQTNGKAPEGWTYELGDENLVWTVEREKNVHDEDNGDWQSTAYEGKQTLFNVENWGAEGPTDVMAISPEIDLSKATSANLEYYEQRTWDNYWPDLKENHSTWIMVSVVGETGWDEVKEIVYNQKDFLSWQKVSIVLDAYAGKTIKIGFLANSHHYFWRIDDITVNGITTGVMENKVNTFEAYPNPATNFITVTNNQNNEIIYSLFDSSGKQVKAFNVKGNESKVVAINLAPGMYYIKDQGANASSIKKIVVK